MKIGGWSIHIDDHEVVGVDGLFGNIMYIIIYKYSSWKTMADFENHGISFEAAVEECVRELENKYILAIISNYLCDFREIVSDAKKNLKDMRINFSRSKTAQDIADQFVEKIRSCENWQELYAELHPTSKFNKEMRRRAIMEIKQLCLRI